MPLSYCCETVRKQDPDRFLLSLFAKEECREALWALYAFNYEIAKTREVVTETQLGLIRLLWWRDALAGVYDRGEVLKHQVLEPLAAAIKKYNLPRALFESLIYAREFDLENRLPANLDGMVHYAEFTSLPLLTLAQMIEGNQNTPETLKAAATAYAMTGILRATPMQARDQHCYLPEDLIQKQGISAYDIYDGTGIEKLKPVTATVVAKAREFQVTASRDKKSSKTLRLANRLTGMYLRQIAAADNNVFSPRLAVPPKFKELRLAWASVFG